MTDYCCKYCCWEGVYKDVFDELQAAYDKLQ